MMEDKSDIIKLVCNDIISDDKEAAQNQLKKLDFERLSAVEPGTIPMSQQNEKKPKRGTIPMSMQIEVFKENNFICQYCGKRTVFIGTLRAINLLLPDDFPYHTHWKWDSTHQVFWELTASCDHIIPVARGGRDEPDNLTTACYLCNSLKTQWTIEELKKSGWIQQNKPVKDDEWDGLTGLFLDIMEKNDIPKLKSLENELKKYNESKILI